MGLEESQGKGARPSSRERFPVKRTAAIAILVVIAIIFFAILDGLRWYRSQPRVFEDVDAKDLAIEEYEFSMGQVSIIAESGYPEAFEILFFEEEINGSIENFRLETWIYYSLSMEYTFVDGELVSENATEVQAGELVENPYQPQQFTEYMSLNEIIASTGIEKYLLVPLENALVEEGELYYADRLAFGMVDGELLYVETVPVEVEE